MRLERPAARRIAATWVMKEVFSRKGAKAQSLPDSKNRSLQLSLRLSVFA
jgi:hypothetical protein